MTHSYLTDVVLPNSYVHDCSEPVSWAQAKMKFSDAYASAAPLYIESDRS